MKNFICICLILSVIFGVCGCSKNGDKAYNTSDFSTNTSNFLTNTSNISTSTSMPESSVSKNNNTGYISSAKPKSSSSVNADSSINLHVLPIPNERKVPNLLSKDEAYDIIIDNFEVRLSKKIAITSGEIGYRYDSYYFTWSGTDLFYFPTLYIGVMISLNSNDFNNLLKQLKKDWVVGRIERMPYIPYEYEYKKTYTLEKKYKDTVIAEWEGTKTICINKINDNEYIAEFSGIFYNPEFKSGIFDIQKDGTGKKRDTKSGWESFD